MKIYYHHTVIIICHIGYFTVNIVDVAGNVMHLVTRPPPSQNRSQPEPANEREENSDINRDQIRHILSDVFANITELSNPMG